MNVATVMRATAVAFDLTVEAMCSQSRRRQVLRARQVAMYVLRKHGDQSYADIGQAFGGRTHATALHAVKKIGSLLVVFNEKIERILAEVNKAKLEIPMRYNMQLGVELRCGKCQERLSTDNVQASCPCDNLRIQRTRDPFSKNVCALVEAADEGTIEAQRRDGEWVPLLEAVHMVGKKPHIGQETEALMRRSIDYWELTRETHKPKAGLMPPLLYWKQYNTLILGFPRISGSTTSALTIAGERGVFAYVARDWTVAKRVQASWGGKGVYTSPEKMGEDLQGLEPMTFVFDGVIRTPAIWDKMLSSCLECVSATDHTEVLILRVGEAL